jgi:hypothetical protein
VVESTAAAALVRLRASTTPTATGTVAPPPEELRPAAMNAEIGAAGVGGLLAWSTEGGSSSSMF